MMGSESGVRLASDARVYFNEFVSSGLVIAAPSATAEELSIDSNRSPNLSLGRHFDLQLVTGIQGSWNVNRF
jgi:hypothetical protein